MKDNIWGTDLADMKLIRNYNKGFRFLLCVIDLFSRYARVVPLKDKKSKIAGENQTNYGSIKAVKFVTDLLKNGGYMTIIYVPIVTYSTHNKGKSAFAERFIRILKN